MFACSFGLYEVTRVATTLSMWSFFVLSATRGAGQRRGELNRSLSVAKNFETGFGLLVNRHTQLLLHDYRTNTTVLILLTKCRALYRAGSHEQAGLASLLEFPRDKRQEQVNMITRRD